MEPATDQVPLLRRISGFYFYPLITLLVPVISLPFLARWTSEPEWAGLVTGYSLGGMISLFVLLGFPLKGTQEAAALPNTAAVNLFSESIRLRSTILILSLLPTAAASWFLAPNGEFFGTYGMALSAAVLGLSGNWYSVGLGRPSWLAKYDVFPRIMGALGGVAIVMAGGGVAGYAAVNIAFALTGYGLMWKNVRQTSTEPSTNPRGKELLAKIWDRAPAMSTEVLTGVYRVLPVTLVALVASSEVVGQYAASDRLFRMSLFAIVALGNGLISWVISYHEPWRRARALASLMLHTCLGLLGCAAIVIIGPPFSSIFYGETYAMSRDVAWCFGTAFLAISVQTALIRFYLLAWNHDRVVLLGATGGACLAVALLLTIPGTYGVLGAAAALAVVEAAQVVWLAIAACRLLSRRRRSAFPSIP